MASLAQSVYLFFCSTTLLIVQHNPSMAETMIKA